jgi:hypothetical protein
VEVEAEVEEIFEEVGRAWLADQTPVAQFLQAATILEAVEAASIVSGVRVSILQTGMRTKMKAVNTAYRMVILATRTMNSEKIGKTWATDVYIQAQTDKVHKSLLTINALLTIRAEACTHKNPSLTLVTEGLTEAVSFAATTVKAILWVLRATIASCRWKVTICAAMAVPEVTSRKVLTLWTLSPRLKMRAKQVVRGFFGGTLSLLLN